MDGGIPVVLLCPPVLDLYFKKCTFTSVHQWEDHEPGKFMERGRMKYGEEKANGGSRETQTGEKGE